MSNLAERIPIIGRIVRASGRAYTGVADKIRADLFDYMIKYGEQFKIPDKNRYLKSAADFINTATGRGRIPFGLERSAIALNSFFFSPRLLFSRLHLVNPIYYGNLHPIARREALKSLISSGTIKPSESVGFTGMFRLGE